VNITAVIKSLQGEVTDFSSKDTLAAANLSPRIRMTVLYYYANKLGYLVAGSSNRSEIRAGYFTKYGDGAADIAPLGCLYKTQVLKLAEHLKVPEHVRLKVPSAGLWRGQTDEKELGISYEKLDQIYAGLDLGLKPSEISKAVGVKEGVVKKFVDRERKTRHKITGPKIPFI
jgi:NAD+ synthase